VGASHLVNQAVEAVPVSLTQLFLTFLKVGAILYGSGYVLLAFLRNDLVLRYGWLTDQQLLDAVAVGQLTPGPLLTTSTFIGYVMAGLPGAILATLGIFLPSVFFVAILNPIVPRLRRWEWSRALLDGINVAAVGLMAGVTFQLARGALIDWPTVLLALIAGLLLFRFRLSSAWLVIGGGVIGLILG
jgi:chromate transporter